MCSPTSKSLPAWTSVYRHAEVLDRHPDGRPHHVKATMRLMGITDKEVLEYNWGPRWVVWDAHRHLSAARAARRIQPHTRG